jgi:hypothetical protein
MASMKNIALNFGIGIVHVGEHQIVVVAILIAHVHSPAFICSGDLEYGILLANIIPVDAAKMRPIVLERAIFGTTAWEVKSRPAFDLLGTRDFSVSVCNR